MKGFHRTARERRARSARAGNPWQIALVAVMAAALGGCSMLPSWLGGGSRSVSPPPGDPVAFDRDSYVIGPEDTLDIVVWQNPELSRIVPVRPDGRISVPLVDDVQAAGLTTQELKLVLAEKLSEFVKNPEVTVIVNGINSKRFYMVGGGVARQNGYPLKQDMRVLDALAVGGGFTTFAKKGDIKVLRREAGGLREYRFDYDAFLRGDAPLESNFLIQPGDTIVVPD